MNHYLTKGTTTPEMVITRFTQLMIHVPSVIVKPLLDYSIHVGLIAISCIAWVLSQHASFPWYALNKKIPVFHTELKAFRGILRECNRDIYIYLGFKISGAGTLVPNRAYLCVQKMIQIDGNDTLKEYKGVVSKNSKQQVNKAYLDDLITQYEKGIASLNFNIQDWTTENVGCNDYLKGLNLPHLLTNYHDNDDPDPGDDDDTGSQDSSDGDDQPTPSAGHSRKRPRDQPPEKPSKQQRPTSYDDDFPPLTPQQPQMELEPDPQVIMPDLSLQETSSGETSMETTLVVTEEEVLNMLMTHDHSDNF